MSPDRHVGEKRGEAREQGKYLCDIPQQTSLQFFGSPVVELMVCSAPGSVEFYFVIVW